MSLVSADVYLIILAFLQADLNHEMQNAGKYAQPIIFSAMEDLERSKHCCEI